MTREKWVAALVAGGLSLAGGTAVKGGIDAQGELDQCQAERDAHLEARIALLHEKGSAILTMGDP